MMKAGIVGGGVMGRLLAFALVNAGWHVTLFDKDDNQTCSMVAAGLLTPIAELEQAPLLIYQLGIESLIQHWPAILEHLPEPIYFQQNGSLLLTHSRDKTELSRFLQVISNKIKHPEVYTQLTRSDIQVLEPDLTHFDQGVFFKDEGQIDNQSLLPNLKNYLISKNVHWVNRIVQDVQPHKIILSDSSMAFDTVFDCRGLGGHSSFAEVRGIRGELIWLYHSAIQIKHPIRLLHPRYKLYLSPRPNDIYILGASEIESADSSPISVRTLLELLSAVYYLHPSFTEARVIKTMTHCRPTLINHLPKIKFKTGLVAINGLYRHGFLIAPALANDVMRYLTQGISSIHFPDIWEAFA